MLYEKPSRTASPVQISNSLFFLIWTGKIVLGVPQVYIYLIIRYFKKLIFIIYYM